jgi:hypothetical protein
VTIDHGDTDPATLPSCPDCGTEGTPGGRFCRACGAPLDPTEPGRGRAIAGPADDEDTGELPRIRTRTAAAGGTARIAGGALAADAPTDPGGPAIRTCRNCGAPNSSRRELCGRCGADLDTGELTARPDPRPYPPAAVEEDDPVRRWSAPVLAVLGVVALLVLGLALAGLGPFDRGPTVAEARFDAQRYDEDGERLPLSDIATRSTLPPQGGASFAADRMVDDDPSTAWNSDGGGEGPEHGIGERIDVVLAEPAWIGRIVVANGDQRDPDTYAANARVKRAQVTLDGGITFVVNLLDEGLGEQAVEFREPVLTTSLRIEILEAFPGDTHPDLAISDLAFEGWPADARDAELAEERAQARPATGPGT